MGIITRMLRSLGMYTEMELREQNLKMYDLGFLHGRKFASKQLIDFATAHTNDDKWGENLWHKMISMNDECMIEEELFYKNYTDSND